MSDTVHFERSHDIVIDTPAAAVLDYVSNPNSWPEWMPATHHIDAPGRPLAQGEQFFEKWATRQGEVALDWSVAQRGPTVWEARTETTFTGPIIARYTVEDVPGGGTRYTRTVINPARRTAPTADMVRRMDDEAAVCLANIKRNVEAGRGRVG